MRRKGQPGAPSRKCPTGGRGPGPPSRRSCPPPARLIARLRFFFPEARTIDLLVPPTGGMNAMNRNRGQGKSKMKTYTIDTENSITAHATKQEAGDGQSVS